MKKKYLRIVIIAAIIVVSTIGIYLINAFSKKPEENVVSEIKTTTIKGPKKIYVNGVVEAVESKNIYLNAEKGKIDTVSVTDGQSVSKGDVLFSYKNETITSQIDEYNNEVASYNKKKSRLQSKREEAKKTLSEKKNQLSQLKDQFGDNNEVATDISSLEAEVQSSDATVASLDSEIESVDDLISQSNSKLSSIKGKEYENVTADVSGIVRIVGSQDDYTNPYIIIDSKDMHIKGSVNEKYISKLQKDQQADVLIIATDKTVKGKIEEVSNKPTISKDIANASSSSSDLSNYEVTLILDSQDNILEGYHIQATIYDGNNDICISKKAILTKEGKSYVFINKDGVLAKKDITYEKKDDKNVKILSGLKEGDKVVTNPSSTTKEGMKCE